MKAVVLALALLLVPLSVPSASAGEVEWKEHIQGGLIASKSGDYRGAGIRFEAAVREARYFGNLDPRYAASLYFLAVAYHRQDRYAEAEPLYKQALAITEKVRGPRHPDVATQLSDLSALYLDVLKDRLYTAKWRRH